MRRREKAEERMEGEGQAGDVAEDVEGEEVRYLPHKHDEDYAGRRGIV